MAEREENFYRQYPGYAKKSITLYAPTFRDAEGTNPTLGLDLDAYYKQMEATAYTYVPGLTTMTTATGRRLQKGIVAVDPKLIPLHTKLYITSDTVDYGYGEAEDTGGVIKGNIVDLAFMSYDECIQFGRRQMIVYILE